MKRHLHTIAILIVCCMIFSCSATRKKSTYVKKNYKELKEAFPQAQVSILNDSIKFIFPNNLMFQSGSADMLESFQPKIVRFAAIMKKYHNTNLLITGYTDNTGEDESNLMLSLDRSKNVKDNLIRNKVAESRLFTWGLGEKKPVASNTTAEGRAKNRRVEFVVLYKPN